MIRSLILEAAFFSTSKMSSSFNPYKRISWVTEGLKILLYMIKLVSLPLEMAYTLTCKPSP